MVAAKLGIATERVLGRLLKFLGHKNYNPLDDSKTIWEATGPCVFCRPWI